MKLHVGGPSVPVVRVSADDMLNQQSEFHFSSRRGHRNGKLWKEHIERSGCKAVIPGQRAVDELRRSRTDDLFTTTVIEANVGTEANIKLQDMFVVYCTDAAELCKRVCAHRNIPMGPVKLQGDHGRGTLKISVQPTASNSVNDLQILAVTHDSNESVVTLTNILNLLKVNTLIDAGADLIITGDLKFLQLLFGIKTGHSKYPCVWCNWCATGNDRDPVDASCQERDVARDVAVFVAHGSDRDKSSKCHGQQAIPCVPMDILRHPKQRVSPCCLHVALGLVNALDQSMVNRVGEEVVHAQLYRPANLTKSPYQGGTFQGNECRKLVKVAAASNWSEAGHPLAAYYPLFVLLNRVYDSVFTARADLTESDLEEMSCLINEFIRTWENLASHLELTMPLKLHVLAVHVMEFSERYRATPGCFGEQDGEASHRQFAQLLDTYRTMGKRSALEHATKTFNACHF